MIKSPTLLLVFAACVGSAQGASFTWLGDLPGGAFSSRAWAVSADGQVVVGDATSANGVEAFRYQNGVMTGLGDLPGRTPHESSATAVSANGSIIAGNSGRYGGTYRPEAFLWSGGSLNGLGFLPETFVPGASQAWALSDDGAVLVGASTAPNGVTAAVYQNGAWHDLGAYPTFDDSSGTAISPDGEVIGGQESDEDLNGQAFLINGSLITPIGGLMGASEAASPTDISTGGSVVVGVSDIASGWFEAFRYADGVMTGLGFLPGGFYSGAWAVSADGSVVVGSSDEVTRSFAGQNAFIWTQAQGMQSLSDVLATQGATGFDRLRTYLMSATGISADGLTIVGVGRNASDAIEGWRAVLDSPIAADTDNDGIINAADNCMLVANLTQLDADNDAYGNMCDGDLNNSGLTTSQDSTLLRNVLNQPASASPMAAAADLNGSGTVTSADHTILRNLLNTAPGPSGLYQ